MANLGNTERVKRLADTLKKLERIQKIPLEQFLGDLFLSDAAERNLQVSIEILLDLGNKLIAKREQTRPQTLADVFVILCDCDILPHSLRNDLVRMDRSEPACPQLCKN
ncbi:MAG: DUF86 domain-containing protein [Candidatus Heimdallarchaeota archaeon]